MPVFSKISTMDVEIQVAVQFIVSFFNGKFNKQKEDTFLNQLRKLLTNKFEGHWYPEKPTKGSAYRCISIENHLDGVIIKAAKCSGIDTQVLSVHLPKRLDLWIDPSEVSYRIGNSVAHRSVHHNPSLGEHGTVVVIYKEGDDCVNSTSEYLAKVLSQLPTVMHEDGMVPKLSSSSTHSSKFSSHKSITAQGGIPHIATQTSSASATQNALQHRVDNHLSPIAKSFTSRTPNNIQCLSNHSFTPIVNPLLNLEYLQKLHWPLLGTGCYDPLAAQLIQNYLIMQELQKFETRRIALQTHYLKMQNIRWPKKVYPNTGKQHNSSSNSSSNNGLQISA